MFCLICGIQTQEILWKTGDTKGKSLMGEGG
jgi:hypothetical protein